MDVPFRSHRITPESNRDVLSNGPYAPHQHDYVQVLVITKGGGVHQIDGEDHPVQPPLAMLVAKGKVHLYTPTLDAEGWMLDFPEEFLAQEATWLFSPFFELSNVPLGDGLLFQQVETLCGLIHGAAGAGGAGGAESGRSEALALVRHLMAALLHLLQCEIRHVASRPHRASDFQVFREFMRLLDESFVSEKEVGFYTRQLRVTRKKLAEVCRTALNRTPQAIIQERCIVEAKRRLLHSAGRVQQLGYDLGYADPSHFTKAFRRIAGETPSAFRNSRLHLLAD